VTRHLLEDGELLLKVCQVESIMNLLTDGYDEEAGSLKALEHNFVNCRVDVLRVSISYNYANFIIHVMLNLLRICVFNYFRVVGWTRGKVPR